MIPIDERLMIDDDQIQTTGDLALCLQRTCMNAVCWTFHIFGEGPNWSTLKHHRYFI